MKVNLIFPDLGTLLDFIATHSKEIRFGKLDKRKVFHFEIKQEKEGYSIIIEPKDASKEAESKFQKIVGLAIKNGWFY